MDPTHEFPPLDLGGLRSKGGHIFEDWVATMFGVKFSIVFWIMATTIFE